MLRETRSVGDPYMADLSCQRRWGQSYAMPLRLANRP